MRQGRLGRPSDRRDSPFEHSGTPSTWCSGPAAETRPTSPRVLITGGAGFIGGHAARSYVDQGFRTLVVDDLSSGTLAAVPDGAEFEALDVRRSAFVRTAKAFRPSLIIHAAAQTSVPASVHDPMADYSRNVLATLQVIDAAKAVNSRLVFLSSGGAIYGETAGASEDEAPKPVSPYGVHKLQAEQAVRSSGLSFAIARLANVYGPGQRTDLEGGVVAIFARNLATRQPVTIYGDGEQFRDFVHVEDVVRALLLLGSIPSSGTWNVGTGVATTVRQLLRMLEQVIGPAVAVSHQPPRRGDVRQSRLVVERLRTLGWTPSLGLQEGLRTVVPTTAPGADSASSRPPETRQ